MLAQEYLYNFTIIDGRCSICGLPAYHCAHTNPGIPCVQGKRSRKYQQLIERVTAAILDMKPIEQAIKPCKDPPKPIVFSEPTRHDYDHFKIPQETSDPITFEFKKDCTVPNKNGDSFPISLVQSPADSDVMQEYEPVPEIIWEVHTLEDQWMNVPDPYLTYEDGVVAARGVFQPKQDATFDACRLIYRKPFKPVHVQGGVDTLGVHMTLDFGEHLDKSGPDPVKTLTLKDLPAILKPGEVFMISEPKYLGTYRSPSMGCNIAEPTCPSCETKIAHEVLDYAHEHLNLCLAGRYGHGCHYMTTVRTVEHNENFVVTEVQLLEYKRQIAEENGNKPIYAIVYVPQEIKTVTNLKRAGLELATALWRRLEPELDRIAPLHRPLLQDQQNDPPAEPPYYHGKRCPKCGLLSCRHPQR